VLCMKSSVLCMKSSVLCKKSFVLFAFRKPCQSNRYDFHLQKIPFLQNNLGKNYTQSQNNPLFL
jgi:hypothetical protein